MRTLLLFAPALMCAGTMVVCVRMMSGHRKRLDTTDVPAPRDAVDAPADRTVGPSEP